MMETSDGRFQFEIIDGDIYEGDRVGDAIGVDNTALGIFVPSVTGAHVLKAFLTADELAESLVLTAPSRVKGALQPPKGTTSPPRCTCGIAVADASRICAERDCPYR